MNRPVRRSQSFPHSPEDDSMPSNSGKGGNSDKILADFSGGAGEALLKADG